MKHTRFLRLLSVLMTLAILLSLFAGLTANAAALYYNSGVRGVICKSLSEAAQSYWTGNYSFEALNEQSGETLRLTLRTKITSNALQSAITD